MKITGFTMFSVGVTIFLGPTALNAQVPENAQVWTTNGHYYERIIPSGNSISWATASSAASAATFTENGTEYEGHLVTITSSDENNFVKALFLNDPPVTAWIGGYQLPEATQSDEGWRWINNEGEIPGSYSVNPFANWAQNEPSNSVIGGTSENVLLGLDERDYLAFGSGSAEWYASTLNGVSINLPQATVTAYVIEYEPVPQIPVEEVGVIADPKSCKADEGDGQGCKTIDEHTLILPASAEVPDSATIVYRAWYFDDPRVNDDAECEIRAPLDVFENFEEADLPGSLILQEYLCGSPRFAVVRTYAPAITIATDTVKVIQEKLADNLFECDPSNLAPADPGHRGIANPQFRDTAVWRSTIHHALEETFDGNYDANVPRSWQGSASERTNACGSSEADTEEKSYFVLGLHIDFGPDNYGPENTLNEFVVLTHYKLLRLRDAVEIAQDDIDDDSDVTRLRKKVEEAIDELLKGHYEHSLEDIGKFLKQVDKTDYNEDYDEYNRHGELKSRGLNIAYTLREKIIPFAP